MSALVLPFADDHHAFHEDAKPGDLSLQLPIRWRSSSNQFTTRMNRPPPPSPSSPATRSIRNRSSSGPMSCVFRPSTKCAADVREESGSNVPAPSIRTTVTVGRCIGLLDLPDEVLHFEDVGYGVQRGREDDPDDSKEKLDRSWAHSGIRPRPTSYAGAGSGRHASIMPIRPFRSVMRAATVTFYPTGGLDSFYPAEKGRKKTADFILMDGRL